MENKKIPTAQLPTKLMLFVRVAAGAYVMYAAYSIKDSLATVAGAEKIFFMAVMVAFPVIGLLLIIHSLKALKEGRFVDGAMDAGAQASAEETDENQQVQNRITFSDDDEQ